MSPVAGPTRVGKSQYLGNTANRVSTGIGSEDQCRENKLCQWYFGSSNFYKKIELFK